MRDAYTFDLLEGDEWRLILDGLSDDTWYRLCVNGDPAGILLRFGVSKNHLVCTGLMAGTEGDDEVTVRALRNVRLGEILSTLNGWTRGQGDFESALHAAVHAQVTDQLFTQRAGLTPPRPGNGGYPREHYEQVAERYRHALEVAPRSPTKYLVDTEHWSAPTIRRWLRECRKLGLITGEPPPVGRPPSPKT